MEFLFVLVIYKGDLDYVINFMGKKIGFNFNIFEIEIYLGVYCGIILIELDRIGWEFEIVEEINGKIIICSF